MRRRREEVTGVTRREGSVSVVIRLEALMGWPPQPVWVHIWEGISIEGDFVVLWGESGFCGRV